VRVICRYHPPPERVGRALSKRAVRYGKMVGRRM
jgi:hypothetical protein